MNRKYFYNSIAFRLAAPPLLGILIYLLVLMFFDSMDMLADNFFSNEVLFVIGLTFLFFEANRLVIVLLNKAYPISEKLRMRIIIQYLLSFAISAFIVSLALYVFFKHVIGFTTIKTELITFNSIYLMAAIFYNLFFFSQFFLNRKNTDKIEREVSEKESIDFELQAFKNQVNPELLFQSLEIIISELHKDKKSADRLVDELSKVYRYSLDNKNNDLISLKEELDSLIPLVIIYKAKYSNYLNVDNKVHKDHLDINLIPGSLQLFLEYALSENVVTESLPLNFKVRSVEKRLIVSYKLNKKLSKINPVDKRLEFLTKAYSYYNSGDNIHDKCKRIEDGHRIFEIPLIEIIDDE